MLTDQPATGRSSKECSVGIIYRSRRGFTLTEILMAVGILGIGLTMVASVFPVAVDQSRRSTDATMSALCARSIAAMMRARREAFVGQYRDWFKTATKSGPAANQNRPAEFDTPDSNVTAPTNPPGITCLKANAIMPREMRIYNPNMFLYEAGRAYDASAYPASGYMATIPYWPYWNVGNYVPLIYVTPLVADPLNRADPAKANNFGPWRVTIIVVKSRGYKNPASAIVPGGGPDRNKSWSEMKTIGAGDYILDRSANCGEAYLIDAVTGAVNSEKLTVASYATANKNVLVQSASTPHPAGAHPPTTAGVDVNNNTWTVLPGAVAVFHTIIGD
jgi:prepilin-type N-terminal cleavage/methylation domain-containing protein